MFRFPIPIIKQNTGQAVTEGGKVGWSVGPSVIISYKLHLHASIGAHIPYWIFLTRNESILCHYLWKAGHFNVYRSPIILSSARFVVSSSLSAYRSLPPQRTCLVVCRPSYWHFLIHTYFNVIILLFFYSQQFSISSTSRNDLIPNSVPSWTGCHTWTIVSICRSFWPCQDFSLCTPTISGW